MQFLREEIEKCIEHIFKAIIAENCLNLGNEPDTINQKAQRFKQNKTKLTHYKTRCNSTIEGQRQEQNIKNIEERKSNLQGFSNFSVETYRKEDS